MAEPQPTPAEQGQWSEIEVAGHRADLFEPATPHPQGYTAIYLHGVHLGRLPGQEGFRQQFDRFGLRVIAPMAGPYWWVDRPCPEFDTRLTPEGFIRGPVLEELSQRYGQKPPLVGLFGTSMGGQGALRMGFKYPRQFPVVAAIAPAIDYHNVYHKYAPISALYSEPEEARQETATLYVHPFNTPPHLFFCCDPADENWFESSDRLQMKLASTGVRHTADLTTTAGGHSWAYYNYMAPTAIEFLIEGLETRRKSLDIIS